MKLIVVIPAPAHLKTAGVRIRYRRLETNLAGLGHSLEIVPIDELAQLDLPQAIYLISKVYDARGLMLMAKLKADNQIVGVDFFDNYFTQLSDARLTGQREWLRQIGGLIDYALCATPAMKGLLEQFVPGIPLHIVNDPYDGFDPDALSRRLHDKTEAARFMRTLQLAWFGIGHNGYFPVGLSDLFAYRDHLAAFRTSGYSVRLTIISNMAGQPVDRYAMLSRLQIPYDIVEWSEAEETDLIARSHLCFLPVNGQNFSTVKSLNRAISALSGGSQILSGGFPLYKNLGNFVYRDATRFLHDLDIDRLALRSETVPALAYLLQEIGDPQVEAAALGRFLACLLPTKREMEKTLVVHGRQTTGPVHKFAQRLGHLSVGTPFSPPGLNYDVLYRLRNGAAEVRLGPAGVEALPDAWLDRLINISGERMQVIPLSEVMDTSQLLLLLETGTKSRIRAWATYGPIMALISEANTRLFGNLPVVLSEMEAPFHTLTQVATEAGFSILETTRSAPGKIQPAPKRKRLTRGKTARAPLSLQDRN